MTRMVENADNDNAERVGGQPRTDLGREWVVRSADEDLAAGREANLSNRMISGCITRTGPGHVDVAAEQRDWMEIGTESPKLISTFARNTSDRILSDLRIDVIGHLSRDVLGGAAGAALSDGDLEITTRPIRFPCRSLKTDQVSNRSARQTDDVCVTEAVSLESLGFARPDSRDAGSNLIVLPNSDIGAEDSDRDGQTDTCQLGQVADDSAVAAPRMRRTQEQYDSRSHISATTQPGFLLGLIAAALTGATLYVYLS